MRCVCAGQAVFPHGAGQSADSVVRNLRKMISVAVSKKKHRIESRRKFPDLRYPRLIVEQKKPQVKKNITMRCMMMYC